MGHVTEIAVLGLGPSLALYKGDEHFAIGVNDIWRKVEADYVVCLDERTAFEPERLAVIDDCTPTHFYSQLPCWAARPDYRAITLQPQFPDYVCQLDIPALPMSHCSPFVAAALAYKLHGADIIHVYGVDLLNHPLLSERSLRRIERHFRTLKRALNERGCSLIIHGSGLLRSL
jgi:hypothetical protein